jgi:putative hydrolase of the HAD superfamily
VLPALARLRSRYAVATLSNGNADLRRMSFADLFTVSLNARDVGTAKPHPLGFKRLTEALGVATEEVLFVGDDPDHDVGGARNAGLRTAWMNRRNERWPVNATAPDVIVSDCEQLASLLDV